jgi:hypothetical protein
MPEVSDPKPAGQANSWWRTVMSVDKLSVAVLSFTLVVTAAAAVVVHFDAVDAVNKASIGAQAQLFEAKRSNRAAYEQAAATSRAALQQSSDQSKAALNQAEQSTQAALKKEEAANRIAAKALAATIGSNIYNKQVDIVGELSDSRAEFTVSSDNVQSFLRSGDYIDQKRELENMKVQVAKFRDAAARAQLIFPFFLAEGLSNMAFDMMESADIVETYFAYCSDRRKACKAVTYDVNANLMNLEDEINIKELFVFECSSEILSTGAYVSEETISSCRKEDYDKFIEINNNHSILDVGGDTINIIHKITNAPK